MSYSKQQHSRSSQYIFTQSPSKYSNHGVINKQRQSYGPTVCLINRLKTSHSDNVESNDQFMQIFMLILQNNRLVEIINRLKKIQESKGQNRIHERERISLKEQNMELKTIIESYDRQKIKQQQHHMKSNYEMEVKIKQLQSINNNLKWKNRQLQNNIEIIKKQKKSSEFQAQKAKRQAQKMGMSMMMSSNIDLHKSIVRQKSMEVDSWKQKAIKFESIINEHKYLINSKQQQIMKLKNRQLQLINQFESQIAYIRTQKPSSKSTSTNTDHSSLANQSNIIQQLKQQIKYKDNQLNKIAIKQRQNSNLKITIQGLQRQIMLLNKNSFSLQDASHHQQQQYESEIKKLIRDKEKLEKKLFKQKQDHQIEINMLRNSISQLKNTIKHRQKQFYDLQNKMHEIIKDNQHINKKLQNMKNKPQTKIVKSQSVACLFNRQKMKASQIQLNSIVSGVLELKDSNERVNRLINSRSIKQSKNTNIYYA